MKFGPDEKLSRVLELLKDEKKRRRTESKLTYYEPSPKQLAFHTAGKSCRERLMLAANQSGKSYASAMEAAIHATGLYPQWWPGYRFEKATNGWCCGESNSVVRETIQRLLLGPPGEHGTGCIPKDAIVEVTTARGIADLVDTIRIRHAPGDISAITLKT
jgi:hypothetical protein